MTLTAENRANLEKLATYLEGLPEDYDAFTMAHYFIAPPKEEVRYAAENGGVAACGAAACAVGHGPAAGILVPAEFVGPSSVDWNGYAGLFVGHYDTAEYDWCFDGTWNRIDNTPSGAAARIRYLLAEGCPPPEMIEAHDVTVWRAGDELRPYYAPYLRDSGRLPKGEDSRSEAECEASQSGDATGGASPNPSSQSHPEDTPNASS